MLQNEKELKESVLAQLSEKRYIHTLGVRETARQMCESEDLAKKADLAVCFHDLFRGRPVSELDELIDRYGIPERYKGNANLSHGKIAAAAMKTDYGICDKDILDAVSYHTTGREDMDLLEKIVFLADAIEPNRDYPGVERLRVLAKTDIDAACLASLEGTISFLESQGLTEDEIDQDTVRARNWLRKTRHMTGNGPEENNK
jgi:predicted HD superfamily hydrolase involved in NAD metabolism